MLNERKSAIGFVNSFMGNVADLKQKAVTTPPITQHSMRRPLIVALTAQPNDDAISETTSVDKRFHIGDRGKQNVAPRFIRHPAVAVG